MDESRSPGRYLAPTLIACAVATTPHAAELTIDRLFDAPALSGPALIGLQVSQDGSRITYLQGKPDNRDRLDLWEYEVRDGTARMLVDSTLLEPAHPQLSDEELARRERQRTAALVGHSGIFVCSLRKGTPVSAQRSPLLLRRDKAAADGAHEGGSVAELRHGCENFARWTASRLRERPEYLYV